MDPSGFFDDCVQRIELHLDTLLPQTSEHSQSLVDAMRYATLNGGKRLRGSLVCATTNVLTGSYEKALDCASAIECMHAYSLVHDDLPCMDDADLRRGQPSCHMKFGYAMATLAGDALQALAFELVLESKVLTEERRGRIANLLAQASGWQGMVGGQAWDVHLAPDSDLEASELKSLNAAKTGELFRASVEMGCIVGEPNTSTEQHAGLRRFSNLLGEAFQVVDDVLDATQPAETTGKTQGQDERLGKQTYPSIVGVVEATRYANELLSKAMGELKGLGFEDSELAELAHRCVDRIR